MWRNRINASQSWIIEKRPALEINLARNDKQSIIGSNPTMFYQFRLLTQFMIKTPTSSLYISGLTAMEVESYFEKFGEEGWLDIEEKILIPLKKLNEFSISKVEMFFGIVASNYTFIIVDLSDMQKKI